MTEQQEKSPKKEVSGQITAPEFVLRLIYLRDDWEKNEGVCEYSKSDGHAIWFVALASNLEISMMDGILPDSAKKKVDEFMSWYANDYGKRQEYPIIDDPKEIQRTKGLIQYVINSFRPPHTEHENFDKTALIDKLLYDRKWFDVIPDRIVHSNDGPWKIRSNWFLGIAADLNLALTRGILPAAVEKDAKDYLDWWTKGREETHKEIQTSDYGPIVINTREDIERGNAIIDKVLESLGVKLKTE